MKLISAITTYREAVEQLQLAANAIDQAHAMLKDLELDNYIDTGHGMYRQTVKSAHRIVDGLLEDLKQAGCPDCGKRLADNIDCLENRCPDVLSAEDERTRDEAQYEAAMEKRWEVQEGR
jgi:hypothetical protein